MAPKKKAVAETGAKLNIQYYRITGEAQAGYQEPGIQAPQPGGESGGYSRNPGNGRASAASGADSGREGMNRKQWAVGSLQ